MPLEVRKKAEEPENKAAVKGGTRAQDPCDVCIWAARVPDSDGVWEVSGPQGDPQISDNSYWTSGDNGRTFKLLTGKN